MYDAKVLVERVMDLVTKFGLKLIMALIVLVVGVKITKWAAKKISEAKSLSALDGGIIKFIANAVKVCLYAIVLISVAGILGIPYASFVAVLGSAGIAIGLALQGSLSNIAAGLLILLIKPFKVGDYVEATGIAGTVTDIGFFSTAITTLDNKVVHYPNSALSNTCITNYSQMDKRRVDLDFNVSYKTDIDKAKQVIYDVAANHELTLKDPEPFVRLSKHDTSAIVFTLRVWCETANYWNVYFDMLEGVKKALDSNGIEIPYSKLDVNIIK